MVNPDETKQKTLTKGIESLGYKVVDEQNCSSMLKENRINKFLRLPADLFAIYS